MIPLWSIRSKPFTVGRSFILCILCTLQESYLHEGFNANLLFKNEKIFSNKIIKISFLSLFFNKVASLRLFIEHLFTEHLWVTTSGSSTYNIDPHHGFTYWKKSRIFREHKINQTCTSLFISFPSISHRLDSS